MLHAYKHFENLKNCVMTMSGFGRNCSDKFYERILIRSVENDHLSLKTSADFKGHLTIDFYVKKFEEK